jgi:hypothetical protein
VKLPASAGAVFQAIVVLCVLLVEARAGTLDQRRQGG